MADSAEDMSDNKPQNPTKLRAETVPWGDQYIGAELPAFISRDEVAAQALGGGRAIADFLNDQSSTPYFLDPRAPPLENATRLIQGRLASTTRLLLKTTKKRYKVLLVEEEVEVDDNDDNDDNEECDGEGNNIDKERPPPPSHSSEKPIRILSAEEILIPSRNVPQRPSVTPSETCTRRIVSSSVEMPTNIPPDQETTSVVGTVPWTIQFPYPGDILAPASDLLNTMMLSPSVISSALTLMPQLPNPTPPSASTGAVSSSSSSSPSFVSPSLPSHTIPYLAESLKLLGYSNPTYDRITELISTLGLGPGDIRLPVQQHTTTTMTANNPPEKGEDKSNVESLDVKEKEDTMEERKKMLRRMVLEYLTARHLEPMLPRVMLSHSGKQHAKGAEGVVTEGKEEEEGVMEGGNTEESLSQKRRRVVDGVEGEEEEEEEGGEDSGKAANLARKRNTMSSSAMPLSHIPGFVYRTRVPPPTVPHSSSLIYIPPITVSDPLPPLIARPPLPSLRIKFARDLPCFALRPTISTFSTFTPIASFSGLDTLTQFPSKFRDPLIATRFLLQCKWRTTTQRWIPTKRNTIANVNPSSTSSTTTISTIDEEREVLLGDVYTDHAAVAAALERRTVHPGVLAVIMGIFIDSPIINKATIPKYIEHVCMAANALNSQCMNPSDDKSIQEKKSSKNIPIPKAIAIDTVLNHLGAYLFKTGPWKNCVVRSDVDPRLSSEYAHFQTLYVKKPARPPAVSNVSSAQLPSSDNSMRIGFTVQRLLALPGDLGAYLRSLLSDLPQGRSATSEPISQSQAANKNAWKTPTIFNPNYGWFDSTTYNNLRRAIESEVHGQSYRTTLTTLKPSTASSTPSKIEPSTSLKLMPSMHTQARSTAQTGQTHTLSRLMNSSNVMRGSPPMAPLYPPASTNPFTSSDEQALRSKSSESMDSDGSDYDNYNDDDVNKDSDRERNINNMLARRDSSPLLTTTIAQTTTSMAERLVDMGIGSEETNEVRDTTEMVDELQKMAEPGHEVLDLERDEREDVEYMMTDKTAVVSSRSEELESMHEYEHGNEGEAEGKVEAQDEEKDVPMVNDLDEDEDEDDEESDGADDDEDLRVLLGPTLSDEHWSSREVAGVDDGEEGDWDEVKQDTTEEDEDEEIENNNEGFGEIIKNEAVEEREEMDEEDEDEVEDEDEDEYEYIEVELDEAGNILGPARRVDLDTIDPGQGHESTVLSDSMDEEDDEREEVETDEEEEEEQDEDAATEETGGDDLDNGLEDDQDWGHREEEDEDSDIYRESADDKMD